MRPTKFTVTQRVQSIRQYIVEAPTKKEAARKIQDMDFQPGEDDHSEEVVMTRVIRVERFDED